MCFKLITELEPLDEKLKPEMEVLLSQGQIARRNGEIYIPIYIMHLCITLNEKLVSLCILLLSIRCNSTIFIIQLTDPLTCFPSICLVVRPSALPFIRLWFLRAFVHSYVRFFVVSSCVRSFIRSFFVVRSFVCSSVRSILCSS